MVQQARFFAERLEKDAGKDVNAQVRRAFALAFQREPDRKELAASAKLIRDEGLAAFCRALLNVNEFVYVY
jgi:TorA maturation chaperone TorD